MNSTASQIAEKRKHAHPLVFLFLMIPFGIASGYVTVTLAFLFKKHGIDFDKVAALAAATILPGVFKFMWAPLVDTSFTLKKWYLVSGIVTAAGIFAMGILPIESSSIVNLTIIIFLANVAVSFLGIAVNGMIAHDIPEDMQGRASGYLNAGNLGGVGVGGGAGLWMAEQLNNNLTAAAILAIASVLCCIGLFWVNEHASTIRDAKILKTMSNLFKDLWLTLKARLGLLALLLCFLPIGTGAAQGLFSPMAESWHASEHVVELWTGILAGIIMTGGCLVGGWICDRMDRKSAYVGFALLQVACALAMAYLPHTEMMYITWTALYNFALGLSYAAFSAFVYEAIGKGAAGTKYTIFASLSNFPIWYMTLLEGWAQTKFGSRGLLDAEAICAVAGIIIFLGVMRMARVTETV